MYTLLTGILLVSYQNCGQSGAIGLETSNFSKLDTPTTGDQLVDISDVQSPPAEDLQPIGQETPVTSPTTPDVKGDESHSSNSPVQPITMPANPKAPNNTESTDSDSHSPGDQASNSSDKSFLPGTYPPVPSSDSESDNEDGNLAEDTTLEVDEDGQITTGHIVSCKRLHSMKIPNSYEATSSKLKNIHGNVSFTNGANVSAENIRGMLDIINAQQISEIKNVRYLVRASAKAISSVENVRGFSLLRSDHIKEIKNLRGISCLETNLAFSLDNVRGYLNIRGNINSLKNFRGILYLDGKIDTLENFRGFIIMKEGSSIGQKSNVKIQNGLLAAAMENTIRQYEK